MSWSVAWHQYTMGMRAGQGGHGGVWWVMVCMCGMWLLWWYVVVVVCVVWLVLVCCYVIPAEKVEPLRVDYPPGEVWPASGPWHAPSGAGSTPEFHVSFKFLGPLIQPQISLVMEALDQREHNIRAELDNIHANSSDS
jgi:hypothetical protein